VSNKAIIHTSQAPEAIGPYSQAVKVGNTVFLSGQIPLDPATMQMVQGSIEDEAVRVFENIKAVAIASGGTVADLVKVSIFLTDLNDFATVNEVMKRYFSAPYPARACVQVAALPRGARIEVEGIMSC